MSFTLPEDIIFSEILPRISSVKSLLKFKSVSKPWYSLISSEKFVKTQLETSSLKCRQIPNVCGKILSKVIEYANKHAAKEAKEDDLKAFDAEFVNVDASTLFELILAAYYLNFNPLLELTYQAVADKMNTSVEEARAVFNIINAFSQTSNRLFIKSMPEHSNK